MGGEEQEVGPRCEHVPGHRGGPKRKAKRRRRTEYGVTEGGREEDGALANMATGHREGAKAKSEEAKRPRGGHVPKHKRQSTRAKAKSRARARSTSAWEERNVVGREGRTEGTGTEGWRHGRSDGQTDEGEPSVRTTS